LAVEIMCGCFVRKCSLPGIGILAQYLCAIKPKLIEDE